MLWIVSVAGVARAEDVTVGLLGLDAVEVPPEQAQAVTQVLRQHLAAARGVKLIAGQDLVEVKLVFGCMDERPGCMSQAGQSLGVERLVYGSVRPPAGGGGVTVVLKQLNVKAGRVEKFISDVVPTRVLHPTSTELGQLAQKWLQVLLLSGLRGGLHVTSVPPGAEVILDGLRVGATPLRLSDVAAGTHVLGMALPGYQQIVRTFEVRGGLVHEIQVTLARRAAGAAGPQAPPGPPPGSAGPASPPRSEAATPIAPESVAVAPVAPPLAPEPARRLGGSAPAPGKARRPARDSRVDLVTAARPPEPTTGTDSAQRSGAPSIDVGKRLRLASYFMAGAAAIVGGVSLYSWRAQVDREDSGRDALRTLQTNLPGMSSDVRDFFSSPARASACEPPRELVAQASTHAVTAAALNNYLDSCRSGHQYADATTGLVATMGSVALLGVVSYVLGSKVLGHDKAATELRKSPWAYRPRLTVVSPAVSANGGSLNLSFQF